MRTQEGEVRFEMPVIKNNNWNLTSVNYIEHEKDFEKVKLFNLAEYPLIHNIGIWLHTNEGSFNVISVWSRVPFEIGLSSTHQDPKTPYIHPNDDGNKDYFLTRHFDTRKMFTLTARTKFVFSVTFEQVIMAEFLN